MSQQFNKTRIATYICMALSASVATNAFAFAEETEKKNKLDEIETIEVTGVRSSLTSALNAKRSSDSISDSIIAEEIGKSSDENIAQALSRISGVSLDRNGSDNQTITVRGVQAALNDIKLNGVSMTSNTDDQSVDLSLFSADILSRIDVIKSPSANQEEGSLGAAINLQTRAPLSAKKNTNVFTVEARYNDLREDTTPRFAYTGIYKLSDKMGVAGSLFYDKNSVRKEEFNIFDAEVREFKGANTKITNTEGELLTSPVWAVLPKFSLARLNLDDKVKQGGTATFQYRPSDETDIRLDGSFSRQEIDHLQSHTRMHNYHKTPNEIVVQEGSGNMATSVVSAKSGNVGTLNQSGRWLNTTDTLVLGAQFEHSIGDDWIISGHIGHASTAQEFTDGYRMNWGTATGKNGVDQNDPSTWCGVNFVNGPEGDALPEFSYCNAYDGNNAETLKLGQIRSDRRDVDDTKNSIYLDASRGLDSDLITSFEFGVKYTDRSKKVRSEEVFFGTSVFENRDTILASDIPGAATSSITEGHFLDGIAPAGLPTDWVYPDIDATLAHVFPNGLSEDLFNPNPLKAWGVDETTYGAYLQANFELLNGEITGNFGVRYAKTEIEGAAHSGAKYESGLDFLEKDENGKPISSVVFPVSDSHNYDNWLPSITLNYLITDDLILRTSAARVLARTNINQLRPGFEVKNQNLSESPTGKGGNVALDPFLADQFDLSLEWYFEEGALLSGALFYKDFKSFTYNTTVQKQFDNGVDGNCVVDYSGYAGDTPEEIAIRNAATSPCADVDYKQSVNGGSGFIQGAELSYQQNYGFLPGLFSHLGSSINYTYADSEAIIDPENADNPYNGLPFLNTSKHSTNATVYWENDDLSLRLAYAYRTKAISKTTSKNSSIVRDDRGTLDFSANYAINKDLKVTFSASNLTDSYDKLINVITDPAASGLTKELTSSLDNISEARTHAIFNYGRSYRLSLRYSF